MTIILHITRRQQWEQARSAGAYRADTLDSEGFIHCSTIDQVIEVANAYYRGQRDLVLLLIEAEKVAPEIRYEGPPGEHAGADAPLFPHIYGPLNLEAVVGVVDFAPGEDGRFSLPDEVAGLL